jgi:hypothetical protein
LKAYIASGATFPTASLIKLDGLLCDPSAPENSSLACVAQLKRSVRLVFTWLAVAVMDTMFPIQVGAGNVAMIRYLAM